MTTNPNLEALLGPIAAEILTAAETEKTETVVGTTGGAMQSHTARAWTMGGQVD